VSASIWELLDFIARWVHVIAGIMWIGNSLLFNWLDRSLRPAHTAERGRPALGTIWLLHSGGFYYVEKTLLDGEPVPRPLHWFKWQAYTTWLTGAALLIVVYYASDRAILADPSLASLSRAAAVGVGVGAIALGCFLYEAMNRVVAPRAPAVALSVWLAGLIAIGIALTRLLSGRAAFLHVGAMLGTIMAANVVFTIVPSQRELVASVGGRGADPAISARAKRVSIHNNYFTFPVIALMVSNHFPMLYGQQWSWVVLLVIVAAGVLVRHLLNIRFTFAAWKPALAATMIVASASLYGLAIAGRRASVQPTTAFVVGPVTFAEARHVIDRRCAVCHSATPIDSSMGTTPAGVTFDTPDEIVARASRIQERAIVTRTMPPANKTHITDAERAILARWIAGGAKP
jgi:uncharacterized membrane protein